MDFPLRPPGQFHSERSGTYRGFEVFSYQTATDMGVDETPTYNSFVQVLLPTAMPAMTISNEGRRKSDPTASTGYGVSIGYPPFDRLFGVYGEYRFVRTAVTPSLVNWLMSIDWTCARRLLMLKYNTITFGETTISAEVGTSISAPQIQGVLNLLIDFLYQLPRGIWPIPLPAPVAGT